MKLHKGASAEVRDDRAFGKAGLATFYHEPDWVGPGSRHGMAHKVVADPSGDGYVCVGTSRPRGQMVGSLAFLRFTARGALLDDLPVLPPGGSPESVTAVITDHEGGIVTAGINKDTTAFVVRVFPAQDKIDATYGANFRAWLERVAGRGQIVRVFALLADDQGRIVVAGAVYRRAGLKTFGPFVVRLRADGTVDSTFWKYGGPPAADSQYQTVFRALGRQRDGTIVAAGQLFEVDGRAVAFVVYLDPDGTPLRSDASKKWSSWFSGVSCIAPDALTGGLVLGGFRQRSENIVQACAIRMLPNGRADISSSGGYLWRTATNSSALEAVATARSGSIVAVGWDGHTPAMFVVNPNGTTPPGFGPTGMVHIADTGTATGLCVSGKQIVVPLKTDEEGFMVAGFRLHAAAASKSALIRKSGDHERRPRR